MSGEYQDVARLGAAFLNRILAPKRCLEGRWEPEASSGKSAGLFPRSLSTTSPYAEP